MICQMEMSFTNSLLKECSRRNDKALMNLSHFLLTFYNHTHLSHLAVDIDKRLIKISVSFCSTRGNRLQFNEMLSWKMYKIRHHRLGKKYKSWHSSGQNARQKTGCWHNVSIKMECCNHISHIQMQAHTGNGRTLNWLRRILHWHVNWKPIN